MPLKLLMILFMSSFLSSYAQDSLTLYQKLHNLPDKFFGSIHRKSEAFEKSVLKASMKHISKLEKQELKMKREMAKRDSASANEIFGDVKGRYASLRNQLTNPASDLQKLYSPRLDSMQTSLHFLQKTKIVAESGVMQNKIQSTFSEYGNIQKKLNQTDFVEKQIQERQTYFANKLKSSNLIKPFHEFEAKVYYYRAQLDEYKQRWEDPTKMESIILGYVTKIPAFKSFFSQCSSLGSLFQLPDNNAVSASMINGMQTRQSVNQIAGNQLGGTINAQNAIGSNITNAQSEIQQLKDKLNGWQSSGDPQMPNFLPNKEKAKTSWKRLETGVNIQSTKSNLFFPTTSDIALSVGYKFNSSFIAGMGISYKVGLGRDIRHIQISHEGMGLRSFVDVKAKSNIWISGGGEMNYLSAFKKIAELKNRSAWQTSILGGISKKYKIRKHNSEVKILYDFLWRNHAPAVSPLVFRTGYSF